MLKEIIVTDKAPSAVGPYSQGIKVGDFVFVSGQIPLDPISGKLIDDDIEKATERVILNLKEILEEAGVTLDDVIKTTVLLKDMKDFDKVNQVYNRYFNEKQPARSCFEAAKLPKDALLEIDVIAKGK